MHVYNLEFPARCAHLTIAGYVFSRVPEYPDRVRALQQSVHAVSEFELRPTTGTHAITGSVRRPDRDLSAVLPWRHEQSTALDDILLLLSVFTSRHVFAVNAVREDDVIVADPRQYTYGRSLKLSLLRRRVLLDDGSYYNAGLQEGLESVYCRIRDNSWRDQFGSGAFLLLFKEACRRQTLESAFAMCWMIWEHFYVLDHRDTTPRDLRQTPAVRRFGYLLRKYEIAGNIVDRANRGIRELISVRNRLIHEGASLDDRTEQTALLFVRATDAIVARALGLVPSDFDGAIEQFQRALEGNATGIEHAAEHE